MWQSGARPPAATPLHVSRAMQKLKIPKGDEGDRVLAALDRLNASADFTYVRDHFLAANLQEFSLALRHMNLHDAEAGSVQGFAQCLESFISTCKGVREVREHRSQEPQKSRADEMPTGG